MKNSIIRLKNTIEKIHKTKFLLGEYYVCSNKNKKDE